MMNELFLLRLIEEDHRAAAFAGHHQIERTVACEIDGVNAHAGTDTLVIRDIVSCPSHLAVGVHRIFVVMHTLRFVFLRVAAVVGAEPFPGNQFRFTATVNVGQAQGVRLRPCVVDRVLLPLVFPSSCSYQKMP